MNKVLQLNERRNAVQWYLRGGFSNPSEKRPDKAPKNKRPRLHSPHTTTATSDRNVLRYLLRIEECLFESMQGQSGLDLTLYVSALHSRLETAMRSQAWSKCSPEEFMSLTPLDTLRLNGEQISFESLVPVEEVKQPLPLIKDALGLDELRHATLCPKCKNSQHGVDEETAQIRASDEGLTALYTCRNPLCRFSWRSG